MSSSRRLNPVQLQYGDQVIQASVGQRLLDAVLGAGIDHRHICGGNGFCTSCRVEVLAGAEYLSSVSPLERERLGPLAGRLRLACQTRVEGPAHVKPARAVSSRFSPFDE